MECFGTTDFDNNSRLITLSAIIISGLQCIKMIAACCENHIEHILHGIKRLSATNSAYDISSQLQYSGCSVYFSICQKKKKYFATLRHLATHTVGRPLLDSSTTRADIYIYRSHVNRSYASLIPQCPSSHHANHSRPLAYLPMFLTRCPATLFTT
jgi:hypothetical protein